MAQKPDPKPDQKADQKPVKKASAKKASVKKASAKKASAKKSTKRSVKEPVEKAADKVVETAAAAAEKVAGAVEKVADTSEGGPEVAGGSTSLLSDDDVHLFNEGTHLRLWERLGSHLTSRDGVAGAHFAVWAPNAADVRVIGDFNGWDRSGEQSRLLPRGVSGIWEGFVPGVESGASYKYHVISQDKAIDKADPYAFHAEIAPQTASKVWDLSYDWNDADWMAERGERQRLSSPFSIYELHLGSWKRVDQDGGSRSMTYREIAAPLVEHIKDLGFSHVEFLPLMEHPFYGSWGYQVTGFFAATSRYGTPQDLKYLIDELHKAGIGVILDWVPSHFPTDEWALGDFDGTHLYEHADPRQGFHPDWKSYIFNLGRPEVQAFLLSSALFWLEEYHIDGLRVDGVASMLYLDYSREEGEWVPNRHGGNENLESIDFLRRFNTEVFKAFPDVQTMAEESTSWPMVSRPTYVGGLGFGFKWDMGWMHDTLQVFQNEPIHRKYHHDQLTFRAVYAYSENYTLPLSHDEVVHGKGSMLTKMPGDDWQKFANLRALYSYQFTVPGKKLLFMGDEFGQPQEWGHDRSLDWHVLDGESMHGKLQRCVGDLARLYHRHPELHEGDTDPSGFRWIDCTDWESSIVSYLRIAKDGSSAVVVVNLTPVVRQNYRIGVPHGGFWREAFNSDAADYGGSGVGNYGGVEAVPHPAHGLSHSVVLSLPPLAVEVFLPERSAPARG
jgi:1,4-alpha-glucan branching enzyme